MEKPELKVWGSVQDIHRSHCLTVKKIVCFKGIACSWHFHHDRDNGFLVQSGRVVVQTRMFPVILNPGKYHEMPAGRVHRFVAVEDSVMYELYFSDCGKADDDSDIHREDVGHKLEAEEFGLLIGMSEPAD